MKIKQIEIVPIEQLGKVDLEDRALCYWFDLHQKKFEKWFTLDALETTT